MGSGQSASMLLTHLPLKHTRKTTKKGQRTRRAAMRYELLNTVESLHFTVVMFAWVISSSGKNGKRPRSLVFIFNTFCNDASWLELICLFSIICVCHAVQGCAEDQEEVPSPPADTVEVVPGSQLLWKIAPRPANSVQVLLINAPLDLYWVLLEEIQCFNVQTQSLIADVQLHMLCDAAEWVA